MLITLWLTAIFFIVYVVYFIAPELVIYLAIGIIRFFAIDIVKAAHKLLDWINIHYRNKYKRELKAITAKQTKLEHEAKSRQHWINYIDQRQEEHTKQLREYVRSVEEKLEEVLEGRGG